MVVECEFGFLQVGLLAMMSCLAVL